MKAPRQVARPGLGTLLDLERSALDQLIGEVELGVRDQRHYDQLEDCGEVICQRIRAAFRGGRS